ncbi:MAG: hypothetical protein AAF579_14785 [Cyanobacteria bacterium P01_C01_bin.118]
MPLPNNPYPNKIDLIYAVSAELASKLRQRFKPVQLSKPKLKDIILSAQSETVSNEQQQVPYSG